MQLFVKCYILPVREDGGVATIVVEVDGDRTVELLKCMIWQKTGVLPSKQKIRLNGKTGFIDNAKIRDVFTKASTLFLV
uniref:Ubiquitin-like protein n=1 Tax=Marseillevirus sp. TaxID=2809551 RepID=A0AA96EMD3_9VIRU|nr:ubiquitin-like protein [Marseillevirus sp.]